MTIWRSGDKEGSDNNIINRLSYSLISYFLFIIYSVFISENECNIFAGLWLVDVGYFRGGQVDPCNMSWHWAAAIAGANLPDKCQAEYVWKGQSAQLSL